MTFVISLKNTEKKFNILQRFGLESGKQVAVGKCNTKCHSNVGQILTSRTSKKTGTLAMLQLTVR